MLRVARAWPAQFASRFEAKVRFEPVEVSAQPRKLIRWFKPWEVLRTATSRNYEIIKQSGPRDPYPGKNGVIEEDALADVILVDGNPLEDISILKDYEKNLALIMKAGKVFKNTLN